MSLTSTVNNLAWAGTVLLSIGATSILITEKSEADENSRIKTLVIYKHTQPKPIRLKAEPQKVVYKTVYKNKIVYENTSNFWLTLLNVESGVGKHRYRPSNKSKSCKSAKGACGHHQLSAIALQDIGCTSPKCLADRDNFQSSHLLAQDYYNLLRDRYKCFTPNTADHLKYLCWNQGGHGGKKIIEASKGKRTLGARILKNMANNSSYSYKTLKKWGSKKASLKFIEERKELWNSKKIN